MYEVVLDIEWVIRGVCGKSIDDGSVVRIGHTLHYNGLLKSVTEGNVEVEEFRGKPRLRHIRQTIVDV